MDFLEESVEWLEGDDRINGSLLAENTIRNMETLKNIKESGEVIGKNLHKSYSEQDIKDLCESIKKGYEIEKDMVDTENDEMDRISGLFDDIKPKKM